MKWSASLGSAPKFRTIILIVRSKHQTAHQSIVNIAIFVGVADDINALECFIKGFDLFALCCDAHRQDDGFCVDADLFTSSYFFNLYLAAVKADKFVSGGKY